MQLIRIPAFPVPSVKAIDQSQKEKSLLRLYIIHHVLAKLGYAEARILECLQSLGPRLVAGGIDDKINSGWEDALDWVSPIELLATASLPDTDVSHSARCG
jgi:hypothetical protein